MSHDDATSTTASTRKSAAPMTLSHFEVVNAHSTSDAEPIFSFLCKKNCICCPEARSGHRSFTDGDYVYIVGGYTARQQHTTLTDVWRFNILTERWQRCTVHGKLPQTLASFSLVYDSRIRCAYIFGGTGVPFGEAAENKLHRLRVQGDTVIVEEQTLIGQLPPKMYGQAMTFKPRDATGAECIYVMGGTSGHQYNMDVWKFQLELYRYGVPTWVCTQLSNDNENPHEGRYRLEIVLHQNRLLSFGGGSIDFCAQFDELLAFDLATNGFVKVPTKADPVKGFPEGRKCHGLVEFGGNVYIFGGCRDYEDASTLRRRCLPMNDVWMLDLETMQWKNTSTMPQSVFFHSATVTEESCVFVFGGCIDAAHHRCNKVQRMWLRPPSLKHFAMRSTYRHAPYLVHKREPRLSDPCALVREILSADAG